jgi:hypothetical protein
MMIRRWLSMRSFALIAVGSMALSFVSSCGNSAEADARAAFVDGREKWSKAAINSYTVEVKYSCFCPSEMVTWTKLEVRDGAIASAVPLDSIPGSGGPVRLDWWSSIDEMFAKIETELNNNDEPPTVTYDAALGYPRSGSFHCPDNVMDCGFAFEYRNLVRLE